MLINNPIESIQNSMQSSWISKDFIGFAELRKGEAIIFSQQSKAMQL